MPILKIKDDSGQIVDMPWSGQDDPSDEEVDSFLKARSAPKQSTGIKGKIDSFIGKRLGQLSGKEEGVLNPEPDKNPLINKSFLPPIEKPVEPEDPRHRLGRYVYNFAKDTLATPLGILGFGLNADPVKEPIGLAPIAKEVADREAGTSNILNKYKTPQRLALPPAPPSKPQTRFLQGPAGTTEVGKTYPIDLGPTAKYTGNEGTVLPREIGEINQIPAELAARQGTSLGSIPELKTDSLQSVLGSLERSKESPMRMPNLGPIEEPIPYEDTSKAFNKPKVGDASEPLTNPNTNNIGEIGLPKTNNLDVINQDPREIRNGATRTDSIAPKESKSAIRSTLDEGKSKPNTLTTAEAARDKAIDQLESKGKGISNDVPYRPIPVEADAKTAVKQWADGNVGAQVRGKFLQERFEDVTDSGSIDKFEAGNREGRLKDVQAYFDSRWEQAKGLGLLSEDQKRINYLRHYFEQASEEVSAKLKTFVSKNPQFAKEGRFPTYKDAEGAGLTPKYKSIPEIIGAYETEFNRAIRNKELYDWLKETGRLTKGTLNDSMSSWQFKGSDGPEIARLIKNAMSRSEGGLGAAADIASATKNIYLGGGVPYTKYNMHGFNILRNDISRVGPVKAFASFLKDPTGNRAVEWYKNLASSEKDILADLSDRGWQGKPISDSGHAINLPNKLADKVNNPVVKGALKLAGKTLETTQNVFEKPLFEKALPALSAQRTLEVYGNLLKKGMAREDALKYAAQIGNDFYGGVDKVLRSSTNKDLSRVAILAPDWLESQVTKAVREWKGLGKTVIGKGSPVDKEYAKSLGRAALIPSIGAISGVGYLGDKLKQRDIGAIDLGKISNGKTRQLPTLTTANEELRTPIVAPIKTLQGNPAALKDILLKNRISTPLSTVFDLVRGEDTFGNPLSGEDKYGRKISGGQALLNYGKEATRPFQHQGVQALVSWLKGDITTEEAINQGLELPLQYSSPPREKKASMSGPRIRLPRLSP